MRRAAALGRRGRRGGAGAGGLSSLERLYEVYDAFVAGRLECIPDYFTPDASYRPSGVFPGMRDRYVGHDGIGDLWHASTEPWEWIRIEPGRTHVSGTDHGVEAGHLVCFRDLKIVEFLAFPTGEEALAELRAD